MQAQCISVADPRLAPRKWARAGRGGSERTRSSRTRRPTSRSSRATRR